MANKFIDANFAQSRNNVIALVSEGKNTYVVCRGEGAAAEVKSYVTRFSPQAVLSPEAFRVIPDKVKAHLMISASSVIKLADANIGDVAIALTQWADGQVNHAFVSEQLQADVLKAATAKKR